MNLYCASVEGGGFMTNTTFGVEEKHIKVKRILKEVVVLMDDKDNY